MEANGGVKANIHPITGAGSGILTALRSNPFGAFLLAMVALAFIVPARKRKSRSKRKRSRKRRKGFRVNPGNPCPKKNPGNPRSKVKKGKRSKKMISKTPITSRIRRMTGRSVSRPAHMVKGSPAAKAYMAKLRAKRKK